MGSQIKPDTLTPVSAFIHFSRLLLSRSSLDERRQSEEKTLEQKGKNSGWEEKKLNSLILSLGKLHAI